MTRGKLEYNNELGRTSFLEYIFDPVNKLFTFKLSFMYFNFIFCIPKESFPIHDLIEWLETKPKDREPVFGQDGVAVVPCIAPTMRSLVNIKVTHPTKGMCMAEDSSYKLQYSNHEVFLTQSDLKNVLYICRQF